MSLNTEIHQVFQDNILLIVRELPTNLDFPNPARRRHHLSPYLWFVKILATFFVHIDGQTKPGGRSTRQPVQALTSALLVWGGVRVGGGVDGSQGCRDG